MESFIGQVNLFAGTFAPRGWAFCQGQLMSIRENSTLFAVIGSNYGGDGVTTFGLPDLRTRVPLGIGNGPGLPETSVGAQGVVNERKGTSAQLGTLGMNYIICLEGVFPLRG